MPRRGEPSRQQQAFLSLLDQQHAASRAQPSDQHTQDHKAGSRKPRKSSSEKQLGGTGKTPGFKLREPGVDARSDQHLQAAQQLQAIFDNAWDLATVRQVLVDCNGSAEAATDVLLALAARGQTNAIGSDAQPPSSSSAPVGNAPLESSYWSWLPEECKDLVLRLLSSQDLAKAAHTCQEFAEHIRQVRAGLGFLNFPPGMSVAAVRGMVQAYTGARTVSLARCAGQLRHTVDFDNIFRAVSQGARARSKGQSLEKLSLKGCIAIRDDDIASLCHRFDSLRGVILDRCEDLTDAALVMLSRYETADYALLDTFEDLNVIQPVGQASSVRQGYSQTLQRALLESNLTAAQAAAAPQNPNASASGQPQPFSDQDKPRHSIMPSGAHAAKSSSGIPRDPSAEDSAGGQGLQTLSLSGCCKVTDKGVAALQRGSPASRSLTCLDVSGCLKLTGAALDVSPKAVLKQLTANSCHGLSSVTIQLPTSSPLESLSMTGCRKLRLAYISAPQLRDLSVDGCPQLASLELQCPSLTTLSASRCGSLSGLTSQFECPVLQQLNLFGCRQLQTEDTEDVLQGLPELTRLNVNGCISLSRLVLPECNKLTWADCSGCASMHHISLASPVLSELQAVACQRLVDVSLLALQDVSLQSTRVLAINLLNCTEMRSLAYPELDAALAQQLARQAGKATTGKGKRKDLASQTFNVVGCSSLPDAVQRALS